MTREVNFTRGRPARIFVPATALMLLGILFAPVVHAQDSVVALKEKIIDIQNAGTLGFRNFSLCSEVSTYGQYVRYPDNKVKAGGKIYFYYEPDNIYTDRSDGIYHIFFTQDMIVEDSDGNSLLNAPTALNFKYDGKTPVLDVYGLNTLTLGDIPPGKYRFVAILHDQLRNAEVRKIYPFEVVP
ncbi:MAG TPA: hypothetical protein VMW87_06435 [Spirochaetia bacterium]|nr:hypothetical protein [Spirochaetia bacterium]